jgi:3-oxoacyl-[acyl-carrier protein] reductase
VTDTNDDGRGFAGKVAFVTGGAMGMGFAFARALCERGASAVLADIDLAGAERAAAELAGEGHTVLAVGCDVSDEATVDAAVARTVDELGGVDVLINNAGLHLSKYNQPFSKLPRHEVRALFDVNVMGIVNCSVACLEPMRARGGGAIVNMSSMASYGPESAYGVSKLAVRGLTISFAHEMADAGIRVNAIAPGLIGTDAALADLPESLVDMLVNERQLIHRLGQIDDIVKTMLFLCGDDGSFITGETLKVSGGVPLFM